MIDDLLKFLIWGKGNDAQMYSDRECVIPFQFIDDEHNTPEIRVS